MTHLRVKELAEAQGFNIKSLSEKAGLAWTTTESLWKETAEQYNRRTLDRIAIALGVRVPELFGGDPEDAREK